MIIEKKYDLKIRTTTFGQNIVKLTVSSKHWNDKVVLQQLLRSGTSIGANYMEADGAVTRKDFTYKLSIARKELKETEYWLTILEASPHVNKELLTFLKQESHELTLIFSSIILKVK